MPISLDVDLLRAAGKQVRRKTRFRGVRSQSGQKRKEHRPHNSSLEIRKRGPDLTIEVTGDGFLYKMVRMMVGAMVRVAIGKMEVREIISGLESGESTNARSVAPSCGLYLMKVWY